MDERTRLQRMIELLPPGAKRESYETRLREPLLTWQTVTLDLPADTPLALPQGKWQRLGEETIRATFTCEELEIALRLAEGSKYGTAGC